MNTEENGFAQAPADDRGLVAACKAGDRSAFEALVVRHQARVYTLCYRMMGNAEEAKDCAQEAFVKAYVGLGGFRGEAAFSTWLHRIAANVCRNRLVSFEYRYLRRAARLDDPDGAAVEPPDHGPSPAAALDRRDRADTIQRALDRLPPEMKAAVVLRDVEGWPYEEIGRMTGERLGTVKSRIARGREMLRAILREAMRHDV